MNLAVRRGRSREGESPKKQVPRHKWKPYQPNPKYHKCEDCGCLRRRGNHQFFYYPVSGGLQWNAPVCGKKVLTNSNIKHGTTINEG